MKVDVIQVGYLMTNCYILRKEGQCLVVDPGDEVEKIRSAIGNDRLLAILITHYHNDHVGALKLLLKYYDVPVYDASRGSEQSYTVGPFSFDVIMTPGHTSDSLTFYFVEENMMFVGDFIFKGSIGRTDLETGNREEMDQSIDRIKQFEGDIVFYPGHGEYTTLKEEKKFNIFFNGGL